jgi:hypothetical protein
MSSEKNDTACPLRADEPRKHRDMRNEPAEISRKVAVMDTAVTLRRRFGECVELARMGPDALASRALSPGARPAEQSLRCVWTRHLRDGRSCGTHVPLATVRAAWQRELARGRAGGRGFFHFAWRGEAWLAYGLPNGEVRGVYCPAHRAQREERLECDPELAAVAASQPAG